MGKKAQESWGKKNNRNQRPFFGSKPIINETEINKLDKNEIDILLFLYEHDYYNINIMDISLMERFKLSKVDYEHAIGILFGDGYIVCTMRGEIRCWSTTGAGKGMAEKLKKTMENVASGIVLPLAPSEKKSVWSKFSVFIGLIWNSKIIREFGMLILFVVGLITFYVTVYLPYLAPNQTESKQAPQDKSIMYSDSLEKEATHKANLKKVDTLPVKTSGLIQPKDSLVNKGR